LRCSSFSRELARGVEKVGMFETRMSHGCSL
jgi:hypothetical protein